jgi:hypothetical protein
MPGFEKKRSNFKAMLVLPAAPFAGVAWEAGELVIFLVASAMGTPSWGIRILMPSVEGGSCWGSGA